MHDERLDRTSMKWTEISEWQPHLGVLKRLGETNEKGQRVARQISHKKCRRSTHSLF